MALSLTLTNTLTVNNPNTHSLVILIDEQNQPLTTLNAEQASDVQAFIEASHFSGKLGKSILRYAQPNQSALLLIGVGAANKLNGKAIQKIAETLYSQLAAVSESATLWVEQVFDEEQLGQLTLALFNQGYRFDKYKSEADDESRLADIALYVASDDTAKLQTVLDINLAIHIGQSTARDLANEPPNVCYPAYLAAQAQALAERYPELLTVKIVSEKDMEQLGMNCFLAVSRGSDRESQLVVMEYNGQAATECNTDNQTGKKAKPSTLTNPIVILGKGITFDTGGISLKPSAGMGEMKFDMAGAAAVLGMMTALCHARLPLQVVGAMACAENMPSGHATRPGDIVTAMNGKTVEILNTDAEGRLVLCDSLVYLQRYQPKVMIDMATLTGAMVVALGNVRTGVFSNDEDVIFDLEQASEAAFDRVWHMPLDDDYQEQLKSNMADMQNIGGMPAGSVTAACFLSRFVEDIPWAHLDIAGTAWNSGKEPSATGRPVPLLMHYLYHHLLEQN